MEFNYSPSIKLIRLGCQWSMVNGQWSFVIGHWSLIIINNIFNLDISVINQTNII